MNNQEKIADVQKDLDTYSLLGNLYESPQGKLLVNTLSLEAIQKIKNLVNNYTSLSHIEMIANCASIKTNFDLIQLLSSSDENKKIVEEELQKILTETHN